jgi:nitrate/TMAO reductase-like tetraheme cytochrome c subunit
MSMRLVVAMAVVWLGVSSAAAGQPPTPPPANDDCMACHGDASLTRDDGRRLAVDGKSFEASTHGPMACVDCHRNLAKAELPHGAKLDRVQCASCHDDIAAKYHDSIHSWAKEKAGLVGAPSCADCHGAHDVKPHTDATSRVFRSRIPETCGSCHAGIHDKFAAGVHGAALRKGDSRAPSCVDCHTAHQIKRVDSEGWRVKAAGECAMCHPDVTESFRRTFHGKVTELGFTTVAACADCHSPHDILPASDPKSTVSKGRLVETCGKCHTGASAQFVAYDPHPNPGSYQRSAVLWWANRFYWILIPGCFGAFGLHSALWFWRARREGRR